MSTEGHIDSYYAATAKPAPRRPQLEGELTVDVCVVGGGLSGCSTALHLAERGYRVALLEGRRIAWGASGRSGGQAIAGFASSQDTLTEQVGLDAARRTVISADSMTPAAATCTRSTTRLVSPPRRKPQVSRSSRTAR